MCCCFLFVFAAKINTETSVFVNENVFVSYEHEICSKNAAHAQCFCICKPFIDYIRVFKRFYCCYIFQFFRRIFYLFFHLFIKFKFIAFSLVLLRYTLSFGQYLLLLIKSLLNVFCVISMYFLTFLIHSRFTEI